MIDPDGLVLGRFDKKKQIGASRHVTDSNISRSQVTLTPAGDAYDLDGDGSVLAAPVSLAYALPRHL